MTYQKTYNDVNKKYWDAFRSKINEVQSLEEARDLFSITVARFLNEIAPELDFTEKDITIVPEEVIIRPDKEYTFKLSDKVKGNPEFEEMLISSDLESILLKYVEITLHRYRHMEQHPNPKGDGKKIIHSREGHPNMKH
jgi:hypothetical protein